MNNLEQQFPLARRVVDQGEHAAAARQGRHSNPSPTHGAIETADNPPSRTALRASTVTAGTYEVSAPRGSSGGVMMER
jgi:hypothetical protein